MNKEEKLITKLEEVNNFYANLRKVLARRHKGAKQLQEINEKSSPADELFFEEGQPLHQTKTLMLTK
jgi:hypothetical protein